MRRRDIENMYAAMVVFQFPSHRDVLCDHLAYVGHLSSQDPLSVPFSSGCALRPMRMPSIRLSKRKLSVPFSSGCALRRGSISTSSRAHPSGFQFPSHRDVLCDIGKTHVAARLVLLSVPFSSGCALRLSAGACRQGPWPLHFQFPSHRDVLCDMSCG